MSYVSALDVLDGWTDPFDSATQTAWLLELIEEAELVLERRIGPLAVWADTSYRQRALRVVVKRMVRRVMRNPAGLMSETDGDYAYRADPDVSSGAVRATPADWSLLGLGGARVGSMRLGSDVRP